MEGWSIQTNLKAWKLAVWCKAFSLNNEGEPDIREPAEKGGVAKLGLGFLKNMLFKFHDSTHWVGEISIATGDGK